MKLAQRVAVVTGGANGIGRALCRRFAAEGARVVVSDLDGEKAAAVAREIGGVGIRADVSREADLVALVERAREELGPVDLFCSNAGIAVEGGVEAPDAGWQRSWEVNVMAHVWAARAVVPSMIERGGGYLVNVASSAGLLTTLGTAPYTVTKHAAVGLAEWLAITYGDKGIKVSCVCPLGVKTDMLADATRTPLGSAILKSGPVLEPEQVAEVTVRGIEEERFLILPHPEVAGYWKGKAEEPERWLGAMRRVQAKLQGPKP